MDLHITKEDIEKQIGMKINDFKCEPLYNNKNECIGLNVNVFPKTEIKYINLTVSTAE